MCLICAKRFNISENNWRTNWYVLAIHRKWEYETLEIIHFSLQKLLIWDDSSEPIKFNEHFSGWCLKGSVISKWLKIIRNSLKNFTSDTTWTLQALNFNNQISNPEFDIPQKERTVTQVFKLKIKFSTSFFKVAVMLNPTYTSNNRTFGASLIWVPARVYVIQETLKPDISIFPHTLNSYNVPIG